MVHRDIKPANIVLVYANQPITHSPDRPITQSPDHPIAKVLDFGIAKIKEAHLERSGLRLTTLTGTGMLIGTPAYMSPEQAMGKRGEELDGRSDLYSLGVVMYQMLAGDLPLKADSEMQMLMAQINTRPAYIRTRRPDLPEAIASLVMRCLEKLPDQRPGSGNVLIEEIEYWEEEPARLARAKAEQERMARERADAKRTQRDKAEQERLAQEMAEATARIKAEREQRDREKAEAEHTERYPEVAQSGSQARPNAVPSSAAGPSEAGRQRGTAAPVGASSVQDRAEKRGGMPLPAKPSRRSWAVIAFVVVLLGFGAWYFSAGPARDTNRRETRTSVPQSSPGTGGEGPAAPSPASQTETPGKAAPTAGSATGASASPPQIPPPVSKPASDSRTRPAGGSGSAKTGAGSTGGRASAPVTASPKPPAADKTIQSPQGGAQRSVVEEKEIKGAKTLCKFHYDNGEYDNAIKACQEGLNLDPSNAELKELMRKVRNAKANDFTAKQ